MRNEGFNAVPVSEDCTPEKALWCSVMLTFLEDMNHFLDIKAMVKESPQEKHDIGNFGLEATGMMARDKIIELANARMRRLIFQAQSPYINHTMEILGINHQRLVSTLVYQYRHSAKVKLTPMDFRSS